MCPAMLHGDSTAARLKPAQHRTLPVVRFYRPFGAADSSPINLRNGRAMLRSVQVADGFSRRSLIASVIHPIEPSRADLSTGTKGRDFLRRAVANIFCEKSERLVASEKPKCICVDKTRHA